MTSVKIFGSKGMKIAKPFEINSADDEPEAMTSEENQIFNYSASDTDETE